MGQNQFIDTNGDMCLSPISFYFLLLPFLASAKSCIYVSSLTSAHVCVLTVHAQCTHAQCTATVHGLETLQIPQKMAPRLQNKEKTCFRIFYLISCHFNRWRVIYSIYSACTAACTVACTVRALYVHCQNTRARHAPPSCSSIGCWNTLVSLGAVLCLPLLFAFW